ncbi:MAG TPA: hypothetical protein DEO88_04100 [Syntrophobacteraceae bacterium]|nr:hypothetical protein [Syntrophobacteraceae bacterium]
MTDMTYAIITPAHNEAQHLPRVIESIVGQNVLPVKWVILDDRSTDDTWRIITTAAQQYPFIQPVQVSGESDRRLGANVVRVFNIGYALVAGKASFFVKMDGDLLLPPFYFASLFEHFQADPELGIASGKTYIWENQQWILERIPDSHAAGQCKTYRSACLQDMGGLVPILGWDILDGVQGRRKGWKSRSFRDIPIRHLRMTGSATGMAKANLRYGGCYYIIRAHPLFVLAKTLYRALERPYLASAAIPVGYLKAALRKEKRLEDLDLAQALRREQVARLLGRQLSQEEWLPRPMQDDHADKGPNLP